MATTPRWSYFEKSPIRFLKEYQDKHGDRFMEYLGENGLSFTKNSITLVDGNVTYLATERENGTVSITKDGIEQDTNNHPDNSLVTNREQALLLVEGVALTCMNDADEWSMLKKLLYWMSRLHLKAITVLRAVVNFCSRKWRK